MISRFLATIFLFGALTAGTASAQTWDTSGNGLLSGQYYMRQVFWVVEDDYGDLGEALSVYGVITFNGSGSYSFSGQVYDSSEGLANYTQTGSYYISASGYGYMDNLITSDEVYGLVSNGIFIGSTTENSDDYNDLFIAAPIGATQATNATLNGSYAIVDLDNPVVDVQGEGGECCGIFVRDSVTTFTATGSGTLNSVTAKGYIGYNGGAATTQNIGSVKYSFSNGAGSLAFSGSYSESNITSALLVGAHYLYISPDGNFVFGGSPEGFDMFVGTRVSSGTAANFNGLYYQAGMDAGLSDSGVDPDSYFGSFYANAGGTQGQGLGHQRFLEWIYDGGPIDLTYGDTYTFSNGDSTDTGVNYNTGQSYIFGNNGAIRIGFGQVPVAGYVGLSVALQAPSLSGSGVYLNPTGILNSASSALFTASLSPGELITLSGTGLAPSGGAVTTNFGTSLNGVRVLMNGTPAPLYYVYPTVIAAIVPYEISPGDVVDIQVVNNGNSSNTISTYAQNTQPGVFTDPPGGLGSAIAQHLDYSLITSSSPAQIGETIIAYLTGLGPVSPAIADGTAPSGLDNSTNTITAYIDGVQATVGYAGLVPGAIALYQMNITVPTGVASGNADLDISGPDSYSTEASLPVTTAAAAVTANATTPHRARPRLKAKGQLARRTPESRPLDRPGLPLKR